MDCIAQSVSQPSSFVCLFIELFIDCYHYYDQVLIMLLFCAKISKETAQVLLIVDQSSIENIFIMSLLVDKDTILEWLNISTYPSTSKYYKKMFLYNKWLQRNVCCWGTFQFMPVGWKDINLNIWSRIFVW